VRHHGHVHDGRVAITIDGPAGRADGAAMRITEFER